MNRQNKILALFSLTCFSAAIGIALLANGWYVIGAVLMVVAFLNAWQGLYLLTARHLP
jgi:hypothetical protein